MTTWDGKERRKMGNDDHDMLTRIDANLTNHFRELKEFKQEFVDHKADDNLNFNKIKESAEVTQKFIWVATGVISCIIFFSRFIK